MDYSITPTCIIVYDSYKVSKKEFNPFLNDLREGHIDNIVLYKRTNWDLTNEWAFHNFLYNIDIFGWFRSHTKNVDMQYPLRWYEKIVYPTIGFISKLFIK